MKHIILNLASTIESRFRAHWNGWQAIYTTMTLQEVAKHSFESGWRFAVANKLEIDYRFAFVAFCTGVAVGVIGCLVM